MSQDAEYDRMLAGKLYITEKINAKHREWPGKLLVQRINALPADQLDEITRLEAQIFGAEDVYVQPPFQVDYGTHMNYSGMNSQVSKISLENIVNCESQELLVIPTRPLGWPEL